ncbi:hypothetical protein DYB31_012979 [Aphanomyces astaci]|uniref:Uncharacterized protein n=1 Tax=Aphanomyces astaci TaxID=112090 RepID=A0A397ESF6_APHAT|nr:hypothetical protein DYB31_012979 [Aphanomyces astaci]
MTSLTTSNNDQFSSIQDVVAMISTDNPAGNNSVQPRIGMDPDDETKSGPSAGYDSRRQTDVSEDKEVKRIYTEPCNEAKSIKTIGETSGSTDVYTGPSAGDNSRRQTDGSEDKEEKGMYAEPSKEESSCRQTEPNTRDASASPDGDSLEPRDAASVLSRILPRVQGPLTTFPEETSDAEEPRAPSRDSTNPVLVQTQLWRVRGGGTMSAVTVGSTRTEYWKQKDPRLECIVHIDLLNLGPFSLCRAEYSDIPRPAVVFWLPALSALGSLLNLFTYC